MPGERRRIGIWVGPELRQLGRFYKRREILGCMLRAQSRVEYEIMRRFQAGTLLQIGGRKKGGVPEDNPHAPVPHDQFDDSGATKIWFPLKKYPLVERLSKLET